MRFGVKSLQWLCDGLFIIWVLHSQPGIEGLDCAGVCDSKCRAIHPTWVPNDIHPWMLCIWVWARATAQVLLHDVATGLLSVDKILADMHRRWPCDEVIRGLWVRKGWFVNGDAEEGNMW